jgi:hypothetical protein
MRNKTDKRYMEIFQKKYGKSLKEIHQYYIKEQTGMVKLIERSNLTKLVLDAENPMESLILDAYNFWTSE